MISEKDLLKVAELARLTMTPEERQAYPQQFAAILKYFEQIARVNTDGVEPLLTPTDMLPHWRDDQAMDGIGVELAMSNAPEKSGNLFKVPPVV